MGKSIKPANLIAQAYREFGLRLSVVRSELLMTQKELADKVGISNRNISLYENGHTYPHTKTICKLATALGCSIEYLTNGQTVIKDLESKIMQFITRKKVVLMYREPPSENYYTEQHMFVDLDQQSGGYATRATMLQAHDFQTVEKANAYDPKGEFIIGCLEIVGQMVIDTEQESIRGITNKEHREKEIRRQQYLALKQEFESE